MKDLFESINAKIRKKIPTENRRLRHSKEREIIDNALGNLSQSDIGTELIEFINEKKVEISVLRGRYNRDHSMSDNHVFISVSEDTNIDDPEITIRLVGAIRETAQEGEQMLRRVGIESGESIYVHREGQKFEDKLYWQTGVVYELGILADRPEFLDSFTLMGYGTLVDAYEADIKIKSGTSNE